ncbi:hypothetical protein [Bacteroides fragilis]|uniref:hypothetical protein n=1 Tax=Bacteroides fragilis TaxID=817 RepID=UPI000B1ED304|nr:hypothetical protein [Bacteroides fragilis]MCZ2668949.1 hypothetical protein [Bacteroides fragilis]WLG15792.1 hypothetical protein [Bacteroides sp.]
MSRRIGGSGLDEDMYMIWHDFHLFQLPSVLVTPFLQGWEYVNDFRKRHIVVYQSF